MDFWVLRTPDQSQILCAFINESLFIEAPSSNLYISYALLHWLLLSRLSSNWESSGGYSLYGFLSLHSWKYLKSVLSLYEMSLYSLTPYQSTFFAPWESSYFITSFFLSKEFALKEIHIRSLRLIIAFFLSFKLPIQENSAEPVP